VVRSLLLVVTLFAAAVSCKREPEVHGVPEAEKKSEGCRRSVGGRIEKDTLFEAGCSVAVETTIVLEKGATLRIGEGVRLSFGKGAHLEVFDGVLVARGTAERPVVFTAASASPKAGDWGGLVFFSPTKGSVLEHTIVEYAGATPPRGLPTYKIHLPGALGGASGTLFPLADLRPAVFVCAGAAPLSLVDTTLRHAPRAGLGSDEPKTFAKAERVRVEDVGGTAMDLPAEALGKVTSLTSTDPVRVREAVKTTQTWPALPGGIVVASLAVEGFESPAILTLAPDSVLRVEPRASIFVGEGQPGALVARRVRFTSAAAKPAPGDWDGLRFGPFSDGTKIEDCIVEHAGLTALLSPMLGAAPVKHPSPALVVVHVPKAFLVQKTTFRANAGPSVGSPDPARPDCAGLDAPTLGNVSIGAPLCAPVALLHRAMP